MKRFLSPAFFLLAGGCFFLPFVSISCNPEQISQQFGEEFTPTEGVPEGKFEITITGLNIVLNTEPKAEGLEDLQQSFEDFGSGVSDASPTDAFPGRVFGIAALAAAVLGVILSFLGRRLGAIVSLALGLGGAIFLFIMKSQLDSQIGPAAFVGFEVNYKYGYWLALGLFVAAALVGLLRVATERGHPSMTPPPLPPPAEPPPV